MQAAIPPPSAATVVVVTLISLVNITVVLFLSWIIYSSHHLSVTVDQPTLTINAPIYGRSIPLSHLQIDSANIINLEADSPYLPKMRTNGIGLPGLSLGWFSLRNGDKALIVLTSRSNVMHIKTTDNYSLLLSVNNPISIIESISMP